MERPGYKDSPTCWGLGSRNATVVPFYSSQLINSHLSKQSQAKLLGFRSLHPSAIHLKFCHVGVKTQCKSRAKVSAVWKTTGWLVCLNVRITGESRWRLELEKVGWALITLSRHLVLILTATKSQWKYLIRQGTWALEPHSFIISWLILVIWPLCV